MKDLLVVARKTLEAYFEEQKFELVEEIKQKYKEKKACFVTLTKNAELRGCVGSLVAEKELWKDVQENVLYAAFHDARFLPLSKEELDKIKIEISILSSPEKIEFENSKDLLKKLNKNYGVIIRKGICSATFLPQVWKEIPNKEKFLSMLCLKAGLKSDEWQNRDVEIHIYKVERVKE